MNNQPTTPSAGTETAAPHVMTKQWVYPFALTDAEAPDTFPNHLAAHANYSGGTFPLSANGLPNGSLHYGQRHAGRLRIDEGFRCIADGEVIAYRLDSDYLRLDYGPEAGKRVIHYSLGFVLVRHWLPLAAAQLTTKPAESATKTAAEPEGIYLYSLYSYNRPLSAYPNIAYRHRPDGLPFWVGHRAFHVGTRCNDQQVVPSAPPPIDSPLAAFNFFDPTTEFRNRPPTPEVGLRIRAEGHGAAEILALLPRGAVVMVDSEKTQGWARITHILAGTPRPAVHRGRVPPEAHTGWVFLGEMDHSICPTNDAIDTVMVLDKPYPVKAGDRLGWLGENPDDTHAAPQDGPIVRAPAMALEVFADGEAFPAYLAQARARAAALPEAEKTILAIAADARVLLYELRPFADMLKAGEVIVPEPDSPSDAPFVRGKRYRTVPQPAGTGTDASKLSGYRTTADGGSRISAAQFRALSKERQAAYGYEERLEKCADTLYWVHHPDEIGAPEFLWDRFPLGSDMAFPVEGNAVACYTRQALDALPPTHRIVAPDGTRWWRVKLTNRPDGLLAWVCDKGLPGVSWLSPQAWPGFQLVDGAALSLRQFFERAVVLDGIAHPSHLDAFNASVEALASSEFIQRLDEAATGTGAATGRVTARHIGKAQMGHSAQALTRLVVRFESHWSPREDRWASLDELMGNDWKAERERQNLRGWWHDVATKIPSFPQDPQVYHVHPYGWIENFANGDTANPTITVRGVRTRISFLQLSDSEPLKRSDFERAAEALQCEVESIQAIALTETGATGAYFVPPKIHATGDDPVPSILFEKHKFSSHTARAFDFSNPRISGPAAKHGPYGIQYEKLLEAYELDPEAALKSTSWGAFQILGENHSLCGFPDVHAFVESISRGEKYHLECLVRLISSQPRWLAPLRSKDWRQFAERYNGPNYEKYGYHKTMADNYEKLKHGAR